MPSKESNTCCGRCLQTAMSTSVDDLKSPFFWRACVGELLGTMFLTMVGCGSCMEWDKPPAATHTQIALAFGLSVGTMVWCLASASGGHINPAVTFAFLVTGKISIARAILYIIFQSSGAIIGAGILRGLSPASVNSLGQTLVNKDIGPTQAFGVEFMITFVLIFTVFATCDTERNDLKGSGPLAIGLSVTMCHLFAIRYTGSSMNPARSFGPAVVMGNWSEHWVYWVGPLLGGVVAGILYEYVFAAQASLQKAKGYLLASPSERSDDTLDRSKQARSQTPQKDHEIEVVEDKTSSV